MHLSEKAKKLLDAGNISALQQLSFEELVPNVLGQEVLGSFLSPKKNILPGDDMATIFTDPVDYEGLQTSCVLSSGHIFSLSTIENYIAANGGNRKGMLPCPVSQEALNLNIAGTGKAYVLLPKVDEAIIVYKRLQQSTEVDPAAASCCFFYRPRKAKPSSNKLREFPYSASEDQFAKHPDKSDVLPSAPPAPPQERFTSSAISTIELRVSRHKVRILLSLNNVSADEYAPQVTHYLSQRLPNSEINGEGHSYAMQTKSFGRCWQSMGSDFLLELWFPHYDSLPSGRRTFNDGDLNDMIKKILRIAGITTTVTDAQVAVKSIAEIKPHIYVTALSDIDITLEQFKSFGDWFLRRTQAIAKELGWPIKDMVTEYQDRVDPTTNDGPAVFGATAPTVGTSTMAANLSNIPGRI